jgi:hypothetical protein
MSEEARHGRRGEQQLGLGERPRGQTDFRQEQPDGSPNAFEEGHYRKDRACPGEPDRLHGARHIRKRAIANGT